MAGTDQPSGLMDIASSLTQEEIPFKLRCAICNKLAVNAFRLPCCDQGICEPCQVTLPDNCPVCAHTPLSSDLCKPNKALRTTLKAFLRTEEKKREKDRQSATPATGTATAEDTPVPSEQLATRAPVSALEDQNVVEERSEMVPSAEAPLEEQPVDSKPEAGGEPASDVIPEAAAEDQPQNEEETQKADTEPNGTEEGDGTTVQPTEPDNTQPNGRQMFPNPMVNMPAGGFPMGWNGPNDFNPMAQFMSNGMFNPANPMGMTMDPMAASQGMFGGFGMNMNGMNMNMGMNFDAGQAMYGGGWDGSQNNMWNGGQDKFNPSAAFANGMGSQYGPSSTSSSSGFGGYNMSPFPNQDFSNGYYGPSGYGRGNYRGRGRGFMSGGRGGGHGVMHTNPAFQNPNATQQISENTNGTEQQNGHDQSPDDTPTDAVNEITGEDPVDAPVAGEGEEGVDSTQLQGIPTIDSLDQTSAGFVGMSDGRPIAPGFGRGYMRGSFPGGRGMGFPGASFGPMSMPGKPMGQGVEGAPAAPRAMRQGLPNTSVLRQRTQSQGGTSIPPSRPSEVSQSETPRDDEPRSKSRSRSRSVSRCQPEVSRRHRHRSTSAHSNADEHDRRRDRDRHRRSRREEKYDEQQQRPTIKDDYRTRSPSLESSRRSSRRDRDRDRDRERDRDRDRRAGRRSHRSHRHRSRSRSPSRDIDTTTTPKENGSSRDKAGETHRTSGKDRSSRREEERERDRDTRRRDRRHRDRGSDRDRDRDRDRHRHRDKDREREKKRSRRDRTMSPVDSEYSSRHHSRRVKRSRDDHDHDHDQPPAPASSTLRPDTEQPEKDPHTLEREARDRERLLREQQRRQAMHTENGTGGSHRHSRDKDRDRDRDRDHLRSSRRRETRQDRLPGGRRLSYKYEDEEGDAARATRVEKEREADRWA